jgi:CRP-like cAMP-binding protein
MPRIVSTEVVVPKKLDPAARLALTDALYEVHSQIFDGVEKKTFAKYVVESKAELTWILLHKGEAGQIVGYLAIHIFERRLRGERCAVFRGEAGTLRAYRGRNTNAGFFLTKILEHAVRHPGKPLYYLGSLVHPSSYAGFAKYAHELWPSPTTRLPADLERFMCDMADEFGLPVVDPRHPLVREVGWITRETDVERRYWRHCDRPPARFFIAQNPGYVRGHGLVTMIHMDPRGLVEITRRFMSAKVEVALDTARVAVQRLPIGAQLLRPLEVGKLLRSVPLFAGLSKESAGAIVASADILGLRPGTFLFREGDAGHDMYLLARGAVFVLSGPPGDEVVIDELDKGAVFGEIAMLSGSTRTASIRTATPCTLVRIQRDVLLSLMKNEPELRETIWRAFAARVFDDFIRASGRFEHLDREARTAWIERGQHQELEARQTRTFEGAAFVFVLSGSVEVEQDGRWSTGQAPLMVEGGATVRVATRTAARVVTVPLLDGAQSAAA